MLLTMKQKQILKAVNSECDGVYDEEYDSINAYVLTCLECIKNYPVLKEDIKKYIKRLNDE